MSGLGLNFISVVLLLSSLSLPVAGFFVWNDPRQYEVEYESNFSSFNIEVCDIEKHKIQVEGWAYVDGEPKISFRVFVKMGNGQYRKIEAFSVDRIDVASNFNLDKGHKKIGFKASYRGFPTVYTRSIIIQVINSKGEEYSALYECG